MSNMFHPVFTDAGRIAAAEDNGQGLSTIITHVVMGTGQYAVRDDNGMPLSEGLEATALQNEQLRVPVYSGGSPNPGQLNLVAEVTKADDADPQFYISEVGFLDADGVLICVWSHQSQNLGYRGDLGSWFLSLGLAWVDLPSDQFTVQVQNAPMAEQSVRLAQLRGQVMEFVTQSGIEYQDTDSTALDRAMGQRISNIVQSLDKSIRTPIAVTPANNASGVLLVPTLQGNEYFSADGYSHIATRFEIRDDTDTLVLDTGELAAAIAYEVPPGTLSVLKEYSWKFQYKGKLGDTEVWSDWSAAAAFTTADVYIDTPSLLSPLNNATELPYQPTLITSAFNVVNGNDIHVASEYQIASDLNFTNILWQSGQVSDLTQTTVSTPLAQGQVAYVRARHFGQTLGSSGWLQPVMITITTNAPPDISGLVHTVPVQGVRGASYPVTFSGALDPDGDDGAVTYQITSPSNISFSKTTNIAQGEVLQVTFADVAAGTAASFTIRAIDDSSGASALITVDSTVIETSVGSDGESFSGGRVIQSGHGVIWETPGTFSLTIPAGWTRIALDVVGAGGGGSGGPSSNAYGGSGAGAAYHEMDVSPGDVYSIVVGQGGGIVTNSASLWDGVNGGSSSFGSVVTALGGAGAYYNSGWRVGVVGSVVGAVLEQQSGKEPPWKQGGAAGLETRLGGAVQTSSSTDGKQYGGGGAGTSTDGRAPGNGAHGVVRVIKL